MNEKQRPNDKKEKVEGGALDKSRAGSKPGKLGKTDVAPEHDPAMEKSGRREFGRDG
jgi:hypothetical protein